MEGNYKKENGLNVLRPPAKISLFFWGYKYIGISKKNADYSKRKECKKMEFNYW